MKAFVIRPTIDVFDGSGALTAEASGALDVVADMVVIALRQGGDTSHRAALWEGVTYAGTPPSLIELLDYKSTLEITLRCLDPNDPMGGNIRSTTNCRAATFGDDGETILCLRHSDRAPVSHSVLINVEECADWLANTDLLDGGWPNE